MMLAEEIHPLVNARSTAWLTLCVTPMSSA